jgi:uncharacterized protein (TIGR00290 family)
MKKLWMSWSTGKDSAFAFFELKKSLDFEVVGLFTTVNEDYGRVAMHSTREILLQLQADALGLPLEIVQIPVDCTNEIYEAKMRHLAEKALKSGVTAMGFGDLFLEDVRAYRERLLVDYGIDAVFPLWKKPTDILAKEILDVGIKAIFTCVDPTKLAPSFAGRFFDEKTLLDLPQGVDPCGENGEFHTFVFASPNFMKPISVAVGEIVQRGGFVFADVLPV